MIEIFIVVGALIVMGLCLMVFFYLMEKLMGIL